MEWHWKEFLFGYGLGILTVLTIIMVSFFDYLRKHFDLGW